MDNWKEFIKLFNSFQYNGIDQYTGTIYHYTSPEGLKGIFDTHSLFATDMYFLNDSSEGMYVIKLIEENIRYLCKENDQLIKCVKRELNLIKLGKWEEQIHNYTISFSCDSDSLEMWNYYTKGNSIQGYNIGFDVSKLADTIQIEILNGEGKQIERNKENHLKLYHGKIIYDKERQMMLISNIFEIFYNKYQEIEDEEMLPVIAHLAVVKTIYYGNFFKAKEFSIEEEYRFIYSTYLLEGRDNSRKGIPCKEEFRIHEGYLIPYQKCKFDVSCIQEVTFSPSLCNEMAEAGLKRLLNQHGIVGEDKIKKSGIPLRF